jgi:glycerate 2-kinase
VEVANSAGLQMVNKEERSPDQACSVVSEFLQVNNY